ncbi:unnamed protein product [Caenorhabditis bovis]|uniref:Uncharacterized protein n=1 Tax=Caenorhabditis bovis TaxID=2654633 RepID=A0A8S1F2X6_9PELO|nr:unnamed protein product [Caenorhabditis bovis]
MEKSSAAGRIEKSVMAKPVGNSSKSKMERSKAEKSVIKLPKKSPDGSEPSSNIFTRTVKRFVSKPINEESVSRLVEKVIERSKRVPATAVRLGEDIFPSAKNMLEIPVVDLEKEVTCEEVGEQKTDMRLRVAIDPYAELGVLQSRDKAFFDKDVIFGNTLRSMINTTGGKSSAEHALIRLVDFQKAALNR